MPPPRTTFKDARCSSLTLSAVPPPPFQSDSPPLSLHKTTPTTHKISRSVCHIAHPQRSHTKIIIIFYPTDCRLEERLSPQEALMHQPAVHFKCQPPSRRLHVNKSATQLGNSDLFSLLIRYRLVRPRFKSCNLTGAVVSKLKVTPKCNGETHK